MIGEMDNRDGSNIDIWFNLRKRALTVIRANLLIFAAFIPAVAILFRNDITRLEDIFSSSFTVIGLGFSLTAIGSAGFTTVLVQFTFRKMIHNTYSENDEEIEETKKFRNLTDFLAISEFLTAISVPLVFLGVLKSVIHITTSEMVIITMFSVGGVLTIHVGATLAYSVFAGIMSWIKEILSKARGGFSADNPETWKSLNLFVVLLCATISVINVSILYPLLTFGDENMFLDSVVVGANVVLSIAIWVVLTGVLFFVYALILNFVDWANIVDVPSEAYR